MSYRTRAEALKRKRYTSFGLSAGDDRGRPVVVVDFGRRYGYFVLDAGELESLKAQLDAVMAQAQAAHAAPAKEGGAP